MSLFLIINCREFSRFGSKVWAVQLLNFRGWELTTEELPLEIRESGLERQNIRPSIVYLSWLWWQPPPTYTDKNEASKVSQYCHWHNRKQTYLCWLAIYKALCFIMWQSIFIMTIWTLTFSTHSICQHAVYVRITFQWPDFRERALGLAFECIFAGLRISWKSPGLSLLYYVSSSYNIRLDDRSRAKLSIFIIRMIKLSAYLKQLPSVTFVGSGIWLCRIVELILPAAVKSRDVHSSAPPMNNFPAYSALNIIHNKRLCCMQKKRHVHVFEYSSFMYFSNILGQDLGQDKRKRIWNDLKLFQYLSKTLTKGNYMVFIKYKK